MTQNREYFYQRITDFIFAEDEPAPADVIFVPGSGTVPDHVRTAARLFREGLAPWIVPSGKYAKAVGHFPAQEAGSAEPTTEWAFMRDELVRLGVPEDRILREDRATFTWENAIRSREVLEKAGIQAHTALLCCQAFHAARCLMYYQQQFPDTKILVIPTVTRDITRDNWFLDEEKTDVVLGEVRRIGDQFSCMLPLGGGRPYRG